VVFGVLQIILMAIWMIFLKTSYWITFMTF